MKGGGGGCITEKQVLRMMYCAKSMESADGSKTESRQIAWEKGEFAEECSECCEQARSLEHKR